MGTYRLDKLQFVVPEGYAIKALALVSPDPAPADAKFPRNLVLSQDRVPAGTTAEAYAQSHLKGLSKSPYSFEVVRNGKLSLADGSQCPVIECNLVGPGGMPLYSMAAYLVIGTEAYCLNATHTRGERFEKAREEFSRILQSLQKAA